MVRVAEMAVNIEMATPMASVTAKPFTMEVPKTIKTAQAIKLLQRQFTALQ